MGAVLGYPAAAVAGELVRRYRGQHRDPHRRQRHLLGTANQPNSTAWYNLSSRFNTTGGVVQARRAPDPANPTLAQTGVYEVRLGNLPAGNAPT